MDLLEQPIGPEEALDILAIQRCLARAVMGNDMLDAAMWGKWGSARPMIQPTGC